MPPGDMENTDSSSASATLACIPPLEPQAPVQDIQGEAEPAGSEDVVMMNPPPSPPPPVAGTKREMVGVKAFALENVKAARVNETENVRPLARDMDKSPFTTAPKRPNQRHIAPLRTATASSQIHAVRPPTQATFQFSVPQTTHTAPQQFPPMGQAQATLPPHVLHTPYMQGQNLVSFVNHVPYGQGPAMIGNIPSQNVVGMTATPATAPGFVHVGPHFGANTFPVQGFPNQAYSLQMQGGHMANHATAFNVGATPQAPTQEYDETKSAWDRLSSSQQEQLVRLYASLQQSSDSSTSQHLDGSNPPQPPHPSHVPPVSLEPEETGMRVDDDQPVGESSKLDKGKAPESRVPIQEDLNEMTSDFGYMLLNKLQESHNQTQNMLTEFMAKQCELQAQFCKTVVRELKGARGDGAELDVESPLPFHTSRRSPQKPAKARTSHSPSTPTETVGKRAARKSQVYKTDGVDGLECPDAVLIALQDAVRTHLKTLLGYTSWQDLVRHYPPLTDEEIEGYGVDGDGVPTPEVKFRIDFVHDWKRLPLNLAARDYVIQTLLGTIKGGGFRFNPQVIPLITEMHIGNTLDMHMEYCRRKYREYYKPNGDSDDEETKKKRKAAAVARKKRNAMNSRKATLLEAREFVVLNLGLSRHAALLDKLLPQHMSGDETDDPKAAHKRYRIIEAQWQSATLKAFLRHLDSIYLEHCATRGGGGSRPRERISSPVHKVEDSHAPDGLWRNCYDAGWLASRPAHQVRRMRVIDSDYDFSINLDRADDVAMGSEDEVEEEL